MSSNLKLKRIWLICGIVMILGSSLAFSQILLTPEMPKTGKQTILYSNQTQDDLKLLFSHAIHQAEDSVYLVIYSLRDRKLIQELKRKSEEGINVTVVCDGKASSGVRRHLGDKVKTVYKNDKGIMHQKILVIDQEYVWIGSANFTSESLSMHGNLVSGMHSPELAEWIRENHDKELQGKAFDIGGQKVELWLTRNNLASVERLKELIQGAEKSARVAMFTWTRTDMVEALSEANERGIKVGAVLDRNSGQGVSRKVAELLKQKMIPVKISTGNGLLHHKMLLIDGKVLVNGSANWTKAAFSQNMDCYIILHDLTKKQSSKLEKLWRVIALESRDIP